MPIPHRMALLDRLQKALAEAQAHRPERQELVADEYDTIRIPGWVAFEREAMFRAVTEERAKLGKRPIPMDLVVRHERMASGHSDYSQKYAIYCMELVLDESPIQTGELWRA